MTTTTTDPRTPAGVQLMGAVFDETARSITTDYRILDTETTYRTPGGAARTSWATLRVTTRHNKGRRAIHTRASRILADDRGGFRSNFDLMQRDESPLPDASEPVGRYNVRLLSAEHDAYLSDHLGTPEKITAALEWAREAVNA